MGLKIVAEMCRACPYAKWCKSKRMEAMGYIDEPRAASAAAPLVEDMAAPVAVKHDYRDIKIGPDTTVTIDLEEFKLKMVKDFYAGSLSDWLKSASK